MGTVSEVLCWDFAGSCVSVVHGAPLLKISFIHTFFIVISRKYCLFSRGSFVQVYCLFVAVPYMKEQNFHEAGFAAASVKES